MTLDTLPPELRTVIYDHLFSDLSIRVTEHGKLDTSQYPYQISEASQSLRNETLPLLHDSTKTSRLKLICEHGHFPEHTRRRLPTRVIRAIRIITILDQVRYDELKPCLGNFPNLLRLEFDLYSLEKIDAAHSNTRFPWSTRREESFRLRIDLMELHWEQERPREGLERDYFPENTLWQAARMSRARRGYDITAQLRVERVHLDGRGVENRYTVLTLDLPEEHRPFPLPA